MRHTEARPLVAINFGVGENPAKRVSDDFENQLVCRLLAAGARIIFDRGFGQAESQRADAVLEAARRAGYQSRKINIVEIDEARLDGWLNQETDAATTNQSGARDADVVVWQGRIGLLAALIGESNLYIGYDSAGQHLAAALGTPCIDVFAGFSAPRMLQRWRPSGEATTRVIAVDTLHKEIDAAAVLAETLQHALALINRKQDSQR
ncbi:MAG: hypothetical protein HY231_17420 [Acidobacteria bacterium]|nr:hypothetical protein [Acidobacteriota bacterium]